MTDPQPLALLGSRPTRPEGNRALLRGVIWVFS